MGRRSRGKRERRRAEPATGATASDPIVGWFAQDNSGALCDGDACVIAGSRQAIEQMLERVPGRRWEIRPTPFSHIWQCLELGAAYAFDESAYQAFLAPARRAGLELEDEDFSKPGPTGVHLVRVQIL